MSHGHGGERDPDQRALDELSRAFANDPDDRDDVDAADGGSGGSEADADRLRVDDHVESDRPTPAASPAHHGDSGQSGSGSPASDPLIGQRAEPDGARGAEVGGESVRVIPAPELAERNVASDSWTRSVAENGLDLAPAEPGSGDGADDDVDRDRRQPGDDLPAERSIGDRHHDDRSHVEADDVGDGDDGGVADAGDVVDDVDDRPIIRIGWDEAVDGRDDELDPTAPTPVPGADGGTAVIAIDDDSLPDAVYVQGSLDADSSGAVVVIEDDDTGDAVAADGARDLGRGIEPRLRDRRRAVRRAAVKKRAIIIGSVVGVIVLAVAALAIAGSGLFSVDETNIELSGIRYSEPADLDPILSDLVDEPILLVDEQAYEERFEALPWISSAEVSVDFPNSATIELVERTPLATFQGPDGRYRVFDRDGRVVDIIDGFPIEFVWITSSDEVDLEPGEFAPAGIAAASELAQNLTPTIRSRIDRLDVAADGSRLVMFLDDGTRVNFGAANELFDKLVRLETLLTQYPELTDARLDVSTAETTRASRPNLASPDEDGDQ